MARRGVRYYRAVPPPEGEWEQDYAAIARSGFELVVVPVPLGGQRDLAPLLRQLELAAKYGLSLVATPAPDAEAARLDAARVRSWANAIREAAPDLPVLVSEPCAGSPALATFDTEGMEWGCMAGDLLPHEVADRARAFARGRSLWIVGLSAHTTAQVRLETWSSLVAPDATLVYEAWRPDLHAGPNVQPGLARPDGTPSPRLAEAGRFDELLARDPALAGALPCPAEAVVVILREAEEFWEAAASQTGYWDALENACRALGSRGAHVEFAPPDALAGYPVAYVPMPFAMSAATADALRRYVEAGGCLVAEAGLARFDEQGRTARETPLHGLAEVFGARALDAPEMLTREPVPTFTGRRGPYPCCACREPLEATTGRVKAVFADGTAAVVENAFGSGTTRLIGTHPSQGCGGKDDKRYAQVILDSLAFAKVKQRVTTSSPDVCVRLLEGEGGVHFLCAFNTGSAAQEAKLRVSRAVGRFRQALHLVSGKEQRLLNNGLRVRIEPGDGVLLRLDAGPRLPHLPRWRPGRRRRDA
ncbi:MAG TPA: beta-galactosidase trimerization domain-containing protein [Planctomycetota bacterium]|nr:beta-galactosidase trimerization domain-containing protein [Planctomycetota bacterium]